MLTLLISLAYEIVTRLSILICVGCFTVAGMIIFKNVEERFDK